MDRQTLIETLNAYDPVDSSEQRHKDGMLTLLDAGRDPFSRNEYDPGHFTASAFILNPKRDRLLLILHGKLNRWLQPGGHVDPTDPDIAGTALREALEETALSDVEFLVEGPFDLDVHAIPERGSSPRHLHFDVRFLLRARTERVVAQSDAKGAGWFAFDDIAGAGADASVMRAVTKCRHHLSSAPFP